MIITCIINYKSLLGECIRYLVTSSFINLIDIHFGALYSQSIVSTFFDNKSLHKVKDKLIDIDFDKIIIIIMKH